MKFCSHCGNQLDDDAIMCPKCGSMVDSAQVTTASNVNAQSESSAPKILGILSIVFGALGGLAGVILGIVGLCIDKKKEHTSKYVTGIVLFFVWLLLYIILLVINATLVKSM